MGMHTHVYVGPYLEAWDFDTKILYSDDILDMTYNARGEIDDQHTYLAPNQALPGICRKTSFDSYDCPPAIEIPDIAKEIAELAKFAGPVIAAIRADGGQVEVRWGIVCGIF